MNDKTRGFSWAEIDEVRSYMVEDVEARDILHLDRLNPWAEDVAKMIEDLATKTPAVATMLISDDYVAWKLDNWRKVKFKRDGTVIIKAFDCVLVVDDAFLLLCMNEDGWHVPIAKGRTITWDGTEEYFSPADIRRLVKETLRRILENTRWL